MADSCRSDGDEDVAVVGELLVEAGCDGASMRAVDGDDVLSAEASGVDSDGGSGLCGGGAYTTSAVLASSHSFSCCAA